MTIDEYLSQPRKLKAKSERLYKQVLKAEAAIGPRDPLNLGDGIPSKSGENGTESRLLNYIDANKEYSDAFNEYIEIRNGINAAIDNLLYWQGCLIHHVYVYNVYFRSDDILNGADEILHTTNRRQILAKLGEAKAALADQLRAQGVAIEDKSNE